MIFEVEVVLALLPGGGEDGAACSALASLLRPSMELTLPAE